MANAPAAPQPTYSPEAGKVAIRDPDGSTWKVAEADLPAALREGARPATEAEYYGAKAGGVGQAEEAFLGFNRGLSFGFSDPLEIEAARTFAGSEAADRLSRELRLSREAFPGTSLAGELGGAIAPMFFGAPPAEAGVAVESALGRAAVRGARALPRAVGEGVIAGIGAQASEDALENHPFTAEAFATSGVKGGALGAILGAGAASGIGALADRFAPRFGRAAEEVAERRGAAVPFVDPDAGLQGALPSGERVFELGAERRPIFLRPDVGQRGRIAAEGPISMSSRWLDPDAGLRAEESFREPMFARDLRTQDLFTEAANERPVQLAPEMWRAPKSVPTELGIGEHFPISVDPEAGLARRGSGGRYQGRVEATDALRQSSARVVPREINANLADDLSAIETREPIRLPGQSAPATSWLEEQGALAAYRAAGAGKGDFRRLGLTAEEQTEQATRLGKRVQELAERSGEPFATTSQAKLAAMLDKEANSVGAELGRMRKTLDEKAFERPTIQSISDRFASDVRPRIASQFPLMAKEELAPAEKFLERMRKAADRDGKLSFDKLHAIRKEIEGTINYERIPGQAPPVGEEARRALRAIVEDEFTLAAEAASRQVGEEFADKYRLTKEAYADYATLKRMSRSKAASNAAGRSFQLKDFMASSAVAAFSGVGALVAPVASKIGRDYGNQITSHALSSLTKLRGAADDAFSLNQALETGAKELFSGKAARAPDKTVTSDDVRAMRAALATPEAIERNISAAIGDLPKYAPRLASSVAAALTRAAVHLRRVLPRDPAPAGAPLQARPPMPIPTSKLRAVSQAMEAIDDPTIVLERMKQGRLTEAHVRALEEVHPETYRRMRDYIRNNAEELRRKLTVQEEIKLSLLFRQPINETLKPSNVAAFQQVFLPPKEPEKKGVGSNIANISPSAGGTRATSWDKAEAEI